MYYLYNFLLQLKECDFSITPSVYRITAKATGWTSLGPLVIRRQPSPSMLPAREADNDIYTSAAALVKFLADDEWSQRNVDACFARLSQRFSAFSSLSIQYLLSAKLREWWGSKTWWGYFPVRNCSRNFTLSWPNSVLYLKQLKIYLFLWFKGLLAEREERWGLQMKILIMQILL